MEDPIRQHEPALGSASGMIGCSPVMQGLQELIARIAPTDASVLIEGESGTGKELVARALHAGSRRRGGPFVAINCAAVPDNLLESELFGHVRGAFTDAKQDKTGLFVVAGGGTLFLDEVTEMSLEVQSRLLRALQEHTVRPVGGPAELPFDARVLAATNQPPPQAVAEGRLREDLYYRLNVLGIHVPALRERGDDVLLLARHFAEQSARRLGRPLEGVSNEAAELLTAYDWPGNVRQLESCMEHAVTLMRTPWVTRADLPRQLRDQRATAPEHLEEVRSFLPLSALERHHVERALKLTGGNKAEAARLLGIERRTIYRKLERYGADDARVKRLDEADAGSPTSTRLH